METRIIKISRDDIDKLIINKKIQFAIGIDCECGYDDELEIQLEVEI